MRVVVAGHTGTLPSCHLGRRVAIVAFGSRAGHVFVIRPHLRRYQLAAFVAAGAFAGWAGALFGIFNRGVFPDFAYWAKSAEVLIMVILGGFGSFWGPAVGAAVLILLNQQITAYTQYWPFILGSILIVLLFAFPGGIVGALQAGYLRARRRRDA